MTIFKKKNKLYTFNYKDNPLVVVGAPHEAKEGRICTPSRTSDIASGYLAMEVFNQLKELDIPSLLVVMNSAKGIDPNKDINTIYSQAVINSGAKVLLEIHGQSDRNKHPLEFSAGKNDISHITRFGLIFYEELLKLNKLYSFALQEKKDKDEAILITKDKELKHGELVLPALRSTLIDEVENYNMSAIHLETMPQFRYKNLEDRKLLSIALSRTLKRLLEGG